MTTPEDRAQLRVLAREATKGPLTTFNHYGSEIVAPPSSDYPNGIVIADTLFFPDEPGEAERARADAAQIAAALDENERLAPALRLLDVETKARMAAEADAGRLRFALEDTLKAIHRNHRAPVEQCRSEECQRLVGITRAWLNAAPAQGQAT